MKILILNTPPALTPKSQAFKYPAHNKDYGVEQDFLRWLKKQPDIVTNDLTAADWHYLPVFWTRWHINHNFATDGEGLNELQAAVDKIIIDDSKTFTVTQFDGGTLLNLGQTIEFTAARTTNKGIDIPILCSPHRKPPLPLKKDYLASFNGAFDTHPIRMELLKRYKDNADILVQGGLPTRFYKRWFWGKSFNINTMKSYIALSPRGTSCNSFRFFEAMQLGTAPCLLGDVDARPFKKFIPWDEISYYAATVDELDQLLRNLDKNEALERGRKAFQYWKNELFYQKWCKYVLKELEQLNEDKSIKIPL
ncbi:exostosin family protein [Mucilaginibacter sp. UR6-11]|uniref:exostosin domain-containing protein n=1 Tax=Mucilaginibacter sp. UR6-11 TaxID=1435644 RepID=UPI001E4F140B|nr:exostosin family protein [Mucilaginibacter sp. UR6-11]MCC8425722.1 glycosyltransferase family 47 protein [Mucilaginibacter sp. UR6-11]